MATEIAVETQQNFIAAWVPSTWGDLRRPQPADNDDVVGLFPKSDHRDVEAAVVAARRPTRLGEHAARGARRSSTPPARF
jgi:hypothetical protein